MVADVEVAGGICLPRRSLRVDLPRSALDHHRVRFNYRGIPIGKSSLDESR